VIVPVNVMWQFQRPLRRMTWLAVILSLGLVDAVAADEFPGATWKRASPESQGLDSAVLAEVLDYVRSKRIPLYSFLIVRNGVVVLDAYFYPYSGREVHDLASMTKSFTSADVRSGGTGKAEAAKLPGAGISLKQCPEK